MQFCGIHIISEVELRRRTTEARESQRRYEIALISSLLYNAEIYRKFAESAIHRPIRLPEDIRPRLAEQLKKNREKQKTKK